ncbi:MAG: CHAT domain-containing protein [Symplocastrum torsivum CPER-KK1]|uniref:CHAT domain-containing protein n=1 Tax=Symplocastrum torsivum CPER-KK1 TaxID=450513 RepID=A0A951PJP2_9CYAN|nr:CHAT domain-containing protein [Symplocastrum torsivum CPER-KK1]
MVFKWLRDLAAPVRKFTKAKNLKQLSRRAVQLYHEGQYGQAISLAEEALELARQVWGEEHPNIATSLNNLAVLYKLQGRLAGAEPLYQEALAMRQRLFPGDHPDVAKSLNNLAVLYESQGGLDAAEPFIEEALSMTKRLFPGDHPDVADSLNNLAGLYESQGRLKAAEPLIEEALAMRKRLFPGDHPDVAGSLNNLAGLYKSQGRLSAATPLLEEVLAMTKRLFLPDHPHVALSLNNLAFLYKSQGHLDTAEPLIEEALAMRKRLFPGDHPDVAGSLSNLAGLYQSQGRLVKAESLLEEALAMTKRLFPHDHPQVALSLNNLAFLYKSQGRLDTAQPLYEEALAMRKRLFPTDHPDVATSLNNLAGLYKSHGRLAEAEPLLEESLAMSKRLLPGDHPNVAKGLNNLAGLLAATHRYSEALERMKEAAAIENRLINQAFAASSESDRLAYLQLLRANFEAFLSLVYQHLHDSPQAKQAALNLVLQRKALTAAALAALNQAIYSGRYPHLTEELKKLRELSARIIHFTFTQPQPDRIPQLQAEHNKLQQQLASQVPEIQLQEQPIDCRTVALELPRGSTLIEFVCFKVFDFHAASGESKWQPAHYLAFILPAGQPDQVQMIDLGEAEPIDQLIQDFRHYASDGNLVVHSLDMGGDDDELEDLRQPPAEVIQLREAIFKPLCPYLQKHQHLFIAPDGNLNLLPFQILPTDETGEQLLMDEYRISYLSVGRDILRSKVRIERSASQPLVIADPDFDLEDLTPPIPLPSQGRGEENSSLVIDGKEKSYFPLLAGEGLGERSKLGVLGTQVAELLQTLAGSAFKRAEGTRFLGEGVAKLLGVSPYLDKEALASRLTGCESPEILLIATHGLFSREVQLQDYWKLTLALLTCPDAQEAELLQKNRKLLDKTLLEEMERVAAILAERGIQNDADWLRNFAPQVVAIIDKSTQQTPIQNSPNSPDQGGNSKIPHPEDPMLRSALAFAGANAWLQGKTLPNEEGKGLVFAQDVAALDLWATELAVLSACNTAIGDIKIGEGVFGLRRAFAVAGAKTLVMSLWSVPDRATALLMQHFFTNLHQGLGRADALQDAQNYIRTITVKELQQSSLGLVVLEELQRHLPQDYQFCQDNRPLEHPYFWGAWVCQGDTTAMVKSQGLN